MNKTLFTAVFTVLLLSFGYSQRPVGQPGGKQGGRGNGNPEGMPKIVIKGMVLDGETNNPLEFATITISKLMDGDVVTGGMTEADGTFNFQSRPGKFKATIDFLSYESVVIEPVPFERGQREIDLGTITLNLSGEIIEGVEIRAEKSETIYKLDKKVFTVGKDLANAGGSAAEILDNVPSLTVDIDGNVNLRGSGNVRMLINGQPSSLLRSGNMNGLRSIQASSIDRVEVITNPSAKYEAEGMAGIINIILKKEEKKGFNGSFNAGIGYPLRYDAGAQLNYRKNAVNFFVNYSSGYRFNPGYSDEISRQLVGDAFRRSYKDADRDRQGRNNRFRVGMDYYLDENQTITFAGSYGFSDDNNINSVRYLDSLEQNNTVEFSQLLDRREDEVEDETNQEYSLVYVNDFGRKGQELTATLRYDSSGELETSNILQSINEAPLENVQNVNIEEIQTNKLAQVDYSKELANDMKIETGLRANLRTIKNDYEVFQVIDNQLSVVDSLTDDFKYTENIYAAYGTLSKTWNEKFSAQIGMRVEQSLISTQFADNSSQDTSYNYLRAFPSTFLTYNIDSKNAIQLSYSRRIQRPRFWYLNPFLTLADDRNVFAGNPKLQPEYTDSYELGYIRYLDKGSLSTNLFYKLTTDVITRVRTFSPDGTTLSFPVNLSEEVSYGLDLSGNYDATKWLRLDANITAFNYNQSADGGQYGIDASDISWFGRIGARVKFWKNASLQTRFNYRAPRENIQGLRKAIYVMDLGVSKDFLDNNLTVTISSRDLLNSRRRQYIIDLQPDYYAEGDSQWRAAGVMLNLSYRINQKKKRGGNRGGGFEGGEDF